MAIPAHVYSTHASTLRLAACIHQVVGSSVCATLLCLISEQPPRSDGHTFIRPPFEIETISIILDIVVPPPSLF